MKSVALVGMGRVGGALAIALPRDRYDIRHRFGVRDDQERLDGLDLIDADLVFITTRDTEIGSAAAQVAKRIRPGSLVYHTSGSRSADALRSVREAGGIVGSIHPLVSISHADLGPERFKGAYFCVEGDAKAVEVGTEIVHDLGGRPFSIPTEFKTLYHAAAVTACGHLMALLDAAVEMMTKTGLDSERSKEILLPLILSTVRNLEDQSPAEALTGTFARADSETFSKHLTALNKYADEELLEIYLLLGERSLELAARQGVSPERVENLRVKVAIAKSKLKW